jgi:hypothetical protein
MSPPTEQLIRDYLNRLSVAARGQLGQDDRRALVDRTRDFIERKAGFAGPPTAIEVGRLLSELGDPATLVQQERQRLAVVRGEMPQPSQSRSPIMRLLRRDSAKPRAASWHWPVIAGRTDLQLTLLDSGGAAEGGANGSNGLVANRAGVDDGLAASEESGPYIPRQSGDPDWFFRSLGQEPESARGSAEQSATAAGDEQEQESVRPGQIVPSWPLDGTSSANFGTSDIDDGGVAGPADSEPTTISPSWQLTGPSDSVLARQARQVVTAVVAWCRRRPLEASAVVLLGLGGAVFPPVWLLGAIVALPSRVWDGRDKWLGLGLPVLLTIIAAALGVTVGGRVSVGQGMHEGWVFGVAGSRVAAVLSASYLCWRSVHGRRPPSVPPWNRPHRVG